MTVILQPIAMVWPNAAGVYAPSRLQKPKRISEQQFLERYADYGRSVKVSFAADGVSNPQDVTAYGRGYWWIVTEGGTE